MEVASKFDGGGRSILFVSPDAAEGGRPISYVEEEHEIKSEELSVI
jgi:hypothetical protein